MTVRERQVLIDQLDQIVESLASTPNVQPDQGKHLIKQVADVLAIKKFVLNLPGDTNEAKI